MGAFDGNIIFIISSILFAGIASFFSPCIFPILPVYMGILSENPGRNKVIFFKSHIFLKPIIKTVLFVLGLSTVFILLGFGAGAIGTYIQSDYSSVIMGTIVIILGLHQMGVLNFSFMLKQKTINLKKEKYEGYVGAYLLGFTFSFGWTPCIGPVLSAILAITIAGNKVFLGGGLMAIYSLGMSVPFLILSILSSYLLERLSGIKPHMEKIKKIGGLLIVLMGILLLFDQFNFLATIFN